MGAETQALVRYYTTLCAQDSDLIKFSMEFPDPAVLLNVLRLLAPERAGPSVQSWAVGPIEERSASEKVINLSPPTSVAVEVPL